MIKGVTSLPNDLETSHEIITDLYQKVSKSNKEEKRLSDENELLRERVNLLMHKLFGISSEKSIINDSEPEMQSLFSTDDLDIREAGPDTEDEEITIKEHQSKKKGRKPLPDFLPRTKIIHDIAESEKQCGCGAQLSCIGEDVFEKLEIIPAVFWVKTQLP